ncbi:MAG: competence protein ComEA [Kiritimatiellia bacterium]|jgi:competence protein ComEA
MNRLSLKKITSIALLLTAVGGFSSVGFSAGGKVVKQPPQKLPAKQVVVAQTININSANAVEIASSLKGIGLKKAEAIIEWRKANGKFTTLDQLTEVKGIGEKTLMANKEKIKL